MHIAENLQGFLMSSHIVIKPRWLRESENECNDNLQTVRHDHCNVSTMNLQMQISSDKQQAAATQLVLRRNSYHNRRSNCRATHCQHCLPNMTRPSYLTTIPVAVSMGSLHSSLPLLLASASSAWYMGTVDVSIPVPIPVTNRPTIICGTAYAEHCRVAPIWTTGESNLL